MTGVADWSASAGSTRAARLPACSPRRRARRAWPSSGGPTSGKSTLFNRLPGRGALHRARHARAPRATPSTRWSRPPDGPLCFVDTAGMRRPSKTERGTEQLRGAASPRRPRAGRHRPPRDRRHRRGTHQDQRLAERIGVSGCPAIVVLNKWDLVGHRRPRRRAWPGWATAWPSWAAAPVLKVSALDGQGRPPHPPGAPRGRRRLPPAGARPARSTAPCATSRPPTRRRGARIRYAVQGAIDPPTFTLFTNGRLPPTYLRYVERRLREPFDLGATPIKLRVRVGGKC